MFPFFVSRASFGTAGRRLPSSADRSALRVEERLHVTVLTKGSTIPRPHRCAMGLPPTLSACGRARQAMDAPLAAQYPQRDLLPAPDRLPLALPSRRGRPSTITSAASA